MMIRETKLRSDKPKGGYRFAILCDGSEKSVGAFQTVSNMMDHSKDQVVAITVKDSKIDHTKIKDVMSAQFTKANVSGNFCILDK